MNWCNVHAKVQIYLCLEIGYWCLVIVCLLYLGYYPFHLDYLNPEFAFEKCKKKIISNNKRKFNRFVNTSQFDINAQKSERIYSKIFTFFKPEGVGDCAASALLSMVCGMFIQLHH